jgi:hypothetical protein
MQLMNTNIQGTGMAVNFNYIKLIILHSTGQEATTTLLTANKVI